MKEPRPTAGKTAGVIVAAAGVTAAVAVYSWRIEPRRLRRRLFRVRVPGLHPALAGARLAFLTDFHVGGPGTPERLTIEALRTVTAWKPDLVLLGGDYFDQGIFRDTNAFDGLSRLERVYAVLGNHDYRQSERAAMHIAGFLQARRVAVLRNEVVDVPLRGSTVQIIGVDDPYTGRDTLPDPRPEAGECGLRIVLAHAPLVSDRLPVGFAHLALSGHTHAGQIRLSPWETLTPLDAAWYLDLSRKRTPSRQQRGWHWIRGMLLYVSAGIGTTTLPLRFLAPPEVVLIELSPALSGNDAPCDHPRRYVSVHRHTEPPLAGHVP